MNIGLIDVDGHNFPNLALMKLSAWHKARGDTVEWWWGFGEYDRVYMSKVFDATYSPDQPEPLNAAEVIKGGTGYGLDNRLPDEVEHVYPDYSLYPKLTRETAFGFLTRGCPRACHFCIVAEKEGRAARKVADLSEWWRGQKNIKLLDPNLLACREHMELLGQLADSGAWVDFTQGLDCRLLTVENIQAIGTIKLKEIHFAWDYIGKREKFGHWEMDSVMGCKGSQKALLTLTERRTRMGIFILVEDHTAESVVKAINRLERKFGKLFYTLFKSITVDNGCEFQDFEGIEIAHRRKGKRTIVFFCHPYSAYERGSNENMNRLIRRFFPKGTNFDNVTKEQVAEAERWINSYPRKLLEWKSASALFDEELKAA